MSDYRPLQYPPANTPIWEGNALSRIWEAWFQSLRELLRFTEVYEATIAAAEVSANTTEEQTFTVSGLTTDMVVFVTKPTHQAGLGVVNARCSAANTLAVTYMNATGSGITPTSEAYKIGVIRP